MTTGKRVVLLVFGTRPEAIKMAPVALALQHSKHLTPIIAVSGQHRKMLDQVLNVFEIKPDVDLGIFTERQTLAGIGARTLERLDPILEQVKPDIVLVQGDTSTTFISALSAFYREIPVGHIEAGLRTNDFYRPFPEEMNRRLTTQLVTLHFAPTKTSRENLEREGVAPETITITGNTVVDSLRWALDQRHANDHPREISEPGFILITVHRRESWGVPIAAIGNAIAELARERPALRFVFPIHRNPAVRETLFPLLEGLSNVSLIEPLDYPSFVWAMKQAKIILTDSGGVQEEAPSLGTPVLVLRDVSERPEALEVGAVKLVGREQGAIVRSVKALLEDDDLRAKMSSTVNPYGDGRAAERIVAAIECFFGFGPMPDPFDPTTDADAIAISPRGL